MTKASLNQLAKNLACEWARDGVRVNSVAPWYTATPLALQVGHEKWQWWGCCCVVLSLAAAGAAMVLPELP